MITKGWTPSEAAEKSANDAGERQNLDQRLGELERGMIIEALKRSGGVQVKAARILGIKEKSLWYRIKKLGIDVASLRAH